MKSKGFTLIELLAIIVILGVLIAIVGPSTFNIIKNSKQKSYNNLVEVVKNAANVYVAENRDNIISTITADGYYELTLQELSDSKLIKSSLTDPRSNEGIPLTKKIYAWQDEDGAIVIYYEDEEFTLPEGPAYVESEGVNRPKLTTGMTAIKWNGTSWEDVENPNTDTSWYDYSNKEWANARTNDCTTPGDIETCSMWVWIPRYVYKISSGWHSDITGTIDVQFSMGIDDTREGTVTLDTGTTAEASNNKWTDHPAFWWDNDSDGERETGEELTGIWVAKFEATASEGIVNGYTSDGSCIAGDNVTTKTAKVIPNATSWRCIQVGNAFTVTRNMETNTVYGWDGTGLGIDTHLIKNIEWGAITYLADSIYGQKANNMWVNPANDYTTGCAGDTYNSSETEGCLRSYDTENGKKASTTGNIYGVYDMVGGALEKVAAYADNIYASGNGLAIVNADSKYKDAYIVADPESYEANYALLVNHKGNAGYETSNYETGLTWYNGLASAGCSNAPWITRGWTFKYYWRSIYTFRNWTDGHFSNASFRPVLLIKAGL